MSKSTEPLESIKMIAFTKLQGIGNDFVFIDQVVDPIPIPNLEDFAKKICDRHKGVGSDGLIIVSRGDLAPFRMTMLNPDGSNGGMCGNGVRCVGRFVIENGHQPMETFLLETENRVVEVTPLSIDCMRVDMGKAQLKRSEIGVLGAPEDSFVDQPVEVLGETFFATGVNMGNPHLVIFTANVADADLERLGPALERHSLFPFGINVHFAQVLGRTRLKVRTWERGAGMTLACGSGACSVGVAAFLNGHTGRQTEIELPGGSLRINFLESGDVLMEGPAERVFEGTWTLEAASA
jgi:diaminopimelate epimerase